MKSTKVISRIIDVLILSVISMYLISAGFRDSRTSGWYQQWFPNLNGSTIKDITFLDSLTGFAVTTTNSSLQAYILKTTNGGDNWNIVHTYIPPSANSGFNRIQFANSNTGYASLNYFDFLKTTNSGLNWTVLTTPWGGEDMAVINSDTIFLTDSDPIFGGVYRSTNGGINWTRIWTSGSSGNPDKIYMYDKNMGFSCNVSTGSNFRKTTNGGITWIDITSDYFLSIKFIDTLIGWKGNGTSIKKTTNGGITWISQTPPNVIGFNVYSISIINIDTVWLGGAGSKIIGNTFYGALCKTTNGGLNWGYQIPNIAVDSGLYINVNYLNNKCGWAYINLININDGIHTKVGGNDTTVYTGINNNVSTIITDYQLFQNYPNPFNAISKIKYKILKSSYIRINVFDILGKEITTLIDKKQNAGTYNVTFDGEYLPSGIYFYSMTIDGRVVDTKKMILLK